MSGAGSRAVAAGSVHARIGRFRRPAGAHGWNVNESWPGPCGSGIPSTPPLRGVGAGFRAQMRTGSMAHCWALRQQARKPSRPPLSRRLAVRGWRGGGGSVFRFVPRMASARRSPPRFVRWWAAVSGGCDGVVVWELHSGREHLVSGTLGCPCKAISLMEDPVRTVRGAGVVFSICRMPLLDLFVVKFSRAHGGCLGIRSRRRTWESAISLVESITGR